MSIISEIRNTLSEAWPRLTSSRSFYFAGLLVALPGLGLMSLQGTSSELPGVSIFLLGTAIVAIGFVKYMAKW